jgi:hypothetical protein
LVGPTYRSPARKPKPQVSTATAHRICRWSRGGFSVVPTHPRGWYRLAKFSGVRVQGMTKYGAASASQPADPAEPGSAKKRQRAHASRGKGHSKSRGRSKSRGKDRSKSRGKGRSKSRGKGRSKSGGKRRRKSKSSKDKKRSKSRGRACSVTKNPSEDEVGNGLSGDTSLLVRKAHLHLITRGRPREVPGPRTPGLSQGRGELGF